jgi:hypothetical protein
MLAAFAPDPPPPPPPPQAFDDVLDEFLSAQKAKKIYIDDIMRTEDNPEGTSREWARLPRKKERAADAQGATEGGGEEGEEGGDEYEEEEEDIEDHPFFAGLRAPPKEDKWDAETILSTYTTTENHPTTIRIARRPRKGGAKIELDPRTGLPSGTMLPMQEERRRLAEERFGGEGEGGSGDDEEYYGRGGGLNEGAARDKKEGAEEKRARKQAAKAAKSARRQEKKGTKEAFREERNQLVAVRHQTTQLPATSLSRW